MTKKTSWKDTSPIYQEFKTKHKLSTEQVDDILNRISWVESKHANVQQDNGGPGQGYYQLEDSSGSGTFGTTLQQYKNIMKDKGLKVPDWVNKVNHDDPKLLTAEQQSELALAGIYQSEGSDKRIEAFKDASNSSVLNQDVFLKDIWINDWWKGAHKDQLEKEIQWDREMDDYNNRDKTASDLVMDKMIISDDPLGMA